MTPAAAELTRLRRTREELSRLEESLLRRRRDASADGRFDQEDRALVAELDAELSDTRAQLQRVELSIETEQRRSREKMDERQHETQLEAVRTSAALVDTQSQRLADAIAAGRTFAARLYDLEQSADEFRSHFAGVASGSARETLGAQILGIADADVCALLHLCGLGRHASRTVAMTVDELEGAVVGRVVRAVRNMANVLDARDPFVNADTSQGSKQ